MLNFHHDTCNHGKWWCFPQTSILGVILAIHPPWLKISRFQRIMIFKVMIFKVMSAIMIAIKQEILGHCIMYGYKLKTNSGVIVERIESCNDVVQFRSYVTRP